MDEFDRRILERLQEDSARPVAVLADEIGLSPSACHRRIKLLEERGVIAGYRARVNPHALGLALEVFVEISLSGQDEKTLEAFETAVAHYPEILECWLTSGGSDYQIRLMVADMADFDRIHRTALSRLPGIASMHSRFVLRRIKDWHGFRPV